MIDFVTIVNPFILFNKIIIKKAPKFPDKDINTVGEKSNPEKNKEIIDLNNTIKNSCEFPISSKTNSIGILPIPILKKMNILGKKFSIKDKIPETDAKK